MVDTPNQFSVDRLDESLQSVEQHLEDLGRALRDRDTDGIDLGAIRLQASLAGTIDLFAAAAGEGRVPESLRARLSRASAQVAAHRESLARATAALDRAIDVLLPRDAATLSYGASGRRERASFGSLAV